MRRLTRHLACCLLRSHLHQHSHPMFTPPPTLPPCRVHAYQVSVATLLASPLGDAEAALAAAFAEARARAPSVVFVDEIDGIGASRDGGGNGGSPADSRLLALLLTEIDGVHSAPAQAATRAVVVLAATNRPEALDVALRRPGRLDVEIEVRWSVASPSPAPLPFIDLAVPCATSALPSSSHCCCLALPAPLSPSPLACRSRVLPRPVLANLWPVRLSPGGRAFRG